jgi:Tfp pilus assembly protein PilN
MIEINLLEDTAPHLTRRIKSGWYPFAGLVSMLLLITGFGSWYWLLVKQQTQLALRESDLMEESRELDTLRRQLETLRHQSNLLEERWSSLRKLETNRRNPVLILNTVVASVPAETSLWLTELRHEQQRLQIRGQALGVSAITDFLARLATAQAFQRVELDHWKEEAEAFRFQITCLPGI